MDRLDLFNRLARKAKPAHVELPVVESLDVPWPETGLDSMDSLMVVIFLTDIYGIPEEAARDFQFETPAQLFELVDAHKTKEPADIEEAMGSVEW